MVYPELVAICARDMRASLQFYRLLGLDVPESQESEAHAEVTLPNGFRIAWDTQALLKEMYPDWQEPRAGQRMTLAFRCDTAAEVDSFYEHIVQSGYHGYKPPWNAFWGQRYAVVIDPDGNLIDLFASL